ncbi:DUF4199 domain-containing protein [Muricauda sp. DJ-13]|uniref:DUF4199 domain-containing protein n=2 Tax=Croceivirga thetidis TaxID=2721623 RepID=A0ABX1GSP9_9FLAO|nr:DUF4199 domain-containing protein [Croceivirga thetidis]
MMENKPKLSKYSIKFGLIAGIIGLVFGLMLFFQGLHYEQSAVTTVINISILFAVVAFCVNQYKKDNEGFLKLGDALKLGTGVALIAAVIGLVWYFLLSNDIIEPGYMDKAMDIAKEKAMENNPQMTDEQWDQGVAMQKKFMWMAYPIGLIFNAILGLVAGLVFGLILRKDRPE